MIGARSRRGRHLVVLRHLPHEAVPRPLREHARNQSDYWQRAVGVLAVLCAAAILVMFLRAPPTGLATRTSVNVTQVVDVDCNLSLIPGLNYVSFNCISIAHDPDALFANTDLSRVVAVYRYLPLGQDRWQVLAPNLPNWTVSDLNRLSRKDGYIIWVANGTNGTRVDYAGFLASTTSVNLYEGFNLVGYPSVVTDNILPALTTINSTFTNVRTYNDSNGSLVRYEYRRGVGGDLQALVPTTGYWVNISTAIVWDVDWNRTG